ncbi:hypothetical protein IVB30_37920 [Bradyrhizobium sp. 200]|uniref:hypothetical protein n=1 Tax=Bradyrhizobium sp. 200 TaxID=2782665 RepID=UPI00200014FB|nr:hypothetical protein [Bradyrhizobium sp. 200]UPJ48732.1 hypothetical protein IVB30_37920 [Bradyrhizobium sp. 200]
MMRDPTTRRAFRASTTAAMGNCALGRLILLVISATLGVMAQAVATEQREQLHFAVNLRGDYAGAASAGFNLADVSTLSALRALPEGMKGVYWLGNGYNLDCSWRLSDRQITDTVMAIKDNPKFSGIYYISDEPHPALCPEAPQRLAERTALIHSLDPRGRTFAVILNNSTAPTEFVQMKDAVDYIGVDPYPCNIKNELTGCNYAALRQRIEQALEAGIPSTRIVPVFQTFGQVCTSSGRNPYYRLPTVAETEIMLTIWDEKVPVKDRPFDMAYSWGKQTVACPTLQMAGGGSHPDLRSFYKNYFARMKGVSPPR